MIMHVSMSRRSVGICDGNDEWKLTIARQGVCWET